MSEVHIAFDAHNHLGETPLWSIAEQALWWVNCEHEPELHRWHPESGKYDIWPMPRRIGGFVFNAIGHSSPTPASMTMHPAGVSADVGRISVPVRRKLSTPARAVAPDARLFQRNGPIVLT